eukprot:TRINITY_DN4886_c0_g1_i1.p1 TRINITY_DN4886_c0_g1~~TRINITY_DN4886_c0_g1_i1.p1  ORF type:complete len:230 (-),score=70.71 TRINITY_DN4886_c0_g1_i1:34-702(-)
MEENQDQPIDEYSEAANIIRGFISLSPIARAMVIGGLNEVRGEDILLGGESEPREKGGRKKNLAIDLSQKNEFSTITKNGKVFTVVKTKNGGWDCNVATGPLDRKKKKISCKVKVLEYSTTDYSGLMFGVHKCSDFNATTTMYTSQGCYVSYGGTKYGQHGSDLYLTRNGTDFTFTVDFVANTFTVEHYGTTKSTSLSSFGNEDICFSFCLYYTLKMEVEFF